MTIINFKPLSNGALIGSFSLLLQSGLQINDCKVFQKDGRHWLGLPQRMYELNGEKKYANVCEIPERETRDKFSNLAVDALKSAGHI